MDTDAALAVRNLSHAFDGRAVLNDVSFEVGRGRFFILIGPNGSGKTTLLRLLAGLLRPAGGSIVILQRPASSYPPRALARRVAYVAQAAPAAFAFTAFQVVLMGRAPHLGMLGFESEQDRALAHQAMQITGVLELAGRRLDQLSGGEQQRVFIARAICQQPSIMLLDEPTAALDLAHQVRVMDLLERLKAERGVTIVMVSHDLNLAAMYADEIMLIDRGRVASLGAPARVLDYAVLEKVYGCTLLVDRSPLGDYPRVHLVPGRYLRTDPKPGPGLSQPPHP